MSREPQQRKHDRVAVRVPTTLWLPARPATRYEGELLDLSLGGAFVHCTAPVGVGETVAIELNFSVPQLIEAHVVDREESKGEKPPMEEQVVVKWARGSNLSGFGVEFRSLSEGNRTALEKLIRYFLQLERSGVQL